MFRDNLLAACAGVLLVGGIASQAPAAVGLQIDLKPAAGSSTTISRMGQEVNLEVWARIEGTSALTTNRQGIEMLAGSFLSTGGSLGFFTPMGDLIGVSATTYEVGVGVEPFTGTGSRRGMSRDLDGDGDWDLGSLDTPSTQWRGEVVMRSNGMTAPSAGKIISIKVGELKYTVSDVSKSGNTKLDFVPRPTAPGNPGIYSAVWQEDGATKNSAMGTMVVNGLNLTYGADPTAPGNRQSNAIRGQKSGNRERFNSASSGMWTAAESGRQTYQMVSEDSVFTGIVAFPDGFGPMTVTLKGVDTDGDPETPGVDVLVGAYQAGDNLDFAEVVIDGLPLAGYGITGVGSFVVEGGPAVPGASMPLAVSFSTETATFDVLSIPEPATAALLVAGMALIGSRRIRRGA